MRRLWAVGKDANRGRGRSAISSTSAAGPGVEHRDVAVQAGHEVARLGLVAIGTAQGLAPGGQIAPARAAAGLGVGGDDLDAGLDQVVPVADAARVALAYDKHDGRGV